MLCPLARCAVLVDDYHAKYRPVGQVERMVGISNWRKLHGIMDTFALANRLLAWVLYPIMITPPYGVPSSPVKRLALYRDKSQIGRIPYNVFTISERRVPAKKAHDRDVGMRGEAIVKKIAPLSSSARPRRAPCSLLSR